MSNTPVLNRVLFGFYVVLTLAVGLAAIIWPGVRSLAYAPLRDALLPNVFLPTRAGMSVKLLIAAPAALEGWVKVSGVEFTQQNALIQVEVTPLRGVDATRRLNTMTGLPDVWIAEADFARLAAGGIPYETQSAPVAQDSFIWVAVKGRSELAGNLTWKTVAQLAGSDPQFSLAMPPVDSMEGMAACLAAAAEYHQTAQVTAAQVNDPAFRDWLKALLQAAPNRSRSPRDQLATRPPQVNAGLLLNSDWRQLSQNLFNYQVPAYNVAFNYPYYIRANWQDVQPDEAEARKAAAAAFREFLLSGGPQSKLADYGLERAGAQLTGRLPAIDEPAIRALQFCWQ